MARRKSSPKGERAPQRAARPTPAQSAPWLERLGELRAELPEAPHEAGTETLRLLEDWLYERALGAGLGGYSGMREYVDYLAKRALLSKEDAATLRRYIEMRNCLAHRAGLLVSPALAEELIAFAARLFRGGAPDARRLMSPRMTTAREEDPLRSIRNRMLNEGISRVPVLRDGRVVGLLTNRDLLSVEGDPEALTVRDAVQADSLERIHFIAPERPYEEVIGMMRDPRVAALLVTEGGGEEGKLLGIITVSDVIARL